MSRARRVATAAVVATAIAALARPPRRADAWDSICYEYADPTRDVELLGAPSNRGCSALLAARGRWRDPVNWLDEHRQILQEAIVRAGLPMAVLDTVVVNAPTGVATVDAGGGRMVPTLIPLPLDAPALSRLQPRGFAVDELAQLPDFSYSLFDWAAGNERCPVPELADEPANLNDPIVCHEFRTHMGALNSSHFPPQSDTWYRWMHRLALARADECRTMRAGAWDSFPDQPSADAFDGRWYPIWHECEAEALAIEAVAQHYLQDSWSSGHMWQRWGSTRLADFEPTMSTRSDLTATVWNAFPDDGRRLMTGEMIAVMAGTIHGSDGPVFESHPALVMNDAACYPTDESIAYVTATGTQPAAGDLHLHDVLGDPMIGELTGRTADALHTNVRSFTTSNDRTSSMALVPHRDRLLGCVTASVREVYDRLADPTTFGPPTTGNAAGAAPLPPGPECNAPRLSAVAWAQGVETPLLAGVKFSVARGNGAVLADVPADIDARLFADYDEARRIGELLAREQPTSKAAADLAWAAFDYDEHICVAMVDGVCLASETRHRHEPAGTLTMLRMEPNGMHDAGAPGVRPSLLADPDLPWGDPQAPDQLASRSPEQYLASTFNRAHAPLWCARLDRMELDRLENDTRTAAPALKAGLCQVCTEVVSRHVTPGAGGKSLCEVLHPGSADAGTVGDPTGVAQRLCGCVNDFAAITDAGLTFARVDGAGVPSSLGGMYDAGLGVTDATTANTATRKRIFAVNGAGQIAGFLWVAGAVPGAVDLELSPADPATPRYTMGGEPRGIAFVQRLGRGWLLVADAATDQLRVFDLGDDQVETFTPCRTIDVGRDPARIEGPWDVVVDASGNTAYVSLRGPVGTPGDAIAMIDVTALVDCNGPAPVVTHVTGFGAGGRGLGAMALSPDGQYLAVASRRPGLCTDQVRTSTASMSVQDVQVGCDEVFVLRVAQLVPGPLSSMAKYVFGMRDSLPTRPVRFPYAVAWSPDSREVAYASLSGYTPWPIYRDFNAVSALALGKLGAPAFPAGVNGMQHWSYDAALPATLRGEAVEFTSDGGYILAGTTGGTLFTFPADAAHDFWQHRDGDPETGIHQNPNGLNRSWYGGCRVADAGCFGGWCPAYCPAGATDAVKSVALGSPVRKLLRL